MVVLLPRAACPFITAAGRSAGAQPTRQPPVPPARLPPLPQRWSPLSSRGQPSPPVTTAAHTITLPVPRPSPSNQARRRISLYPSAHSAAPFRLATRQLIR